MKAPERRDRWSNRWIPPDAEWLEYHYVELVLMTDEITEEVGCHRDTVKRWLKKVGVPIRTSAETKFLREGITKPSIGRLKEQYLDQRKSCGLIADEVGCSPQSIRKWLKKAGVVLRDHRHKEVFLSRGKGRRLLLASEIPTACAWCGQKDPAAGVSKAQALQIHHKDHDCRNNDLKNLMWLCPKCHRFETRLWYLLKSGKATLECKGNQMIITFVKKEV